MVNDDIEQSNGGGSDVLSLTALLPDGESAGGVTVVPPSEVPAALGRVFGAAFLGVLVSITSGIAEIWASIAEAVNTALAAPTLLIKRGTTIVSSLGDATLTVSQTALSPLGPLALPATVAITLATVYVVSVGTQRALRVVAGDPEVTRIG
jgi:hypothetical protein